MRKQYLSVYVLFIFTQLCGEILIGCTNFAIHGDSDGLLGLGDL